MTDNQWTPEPWRPGDSRGRVVTGSPGSSECGGWYLTLTDIDRACVCVNACRGIPTVALEAGAVNAASLDLLAACEDALVLRNLIHKYEHLRQFDEDLRTDATESQQSSIYRQVLKIERQCRAAIAKAKGTP